MAKKQCFVICPIGANGSPERKRAEELHEYLIQPVLAEFDYEVKRADLLPEPGLITTQIMDHVMNDDLVVADLTGRNANVFYELGLRHAIRKPLVQLAASQQDLPFDVAGMRTIFVDTGDLTSVMKHAKDELTAQLEHLKTDPEAGENPISVAVDLSKFRSSDNPAEQLLGDVMAGLAELRGAVRELQQRPPLYAAGSSLIGGGSLIPGGSVIDAPQLGGYLAPVTPGTISVDASVIGAGRSVPGKIRAGTIPTQHATIGDLGLSPEQAKTVSDALGGQNEQPNEPAKGSRKGAKEQKSKRRAPRSSGPKAGD